MINNLPSPPEAFVSGLTGGTFYNIVWDPSGAASLFALPSDNDVGPQAGPPWNTRHTFIMPQRGKLHAVHVKGSALYASTNTVVDGAGSPLPVDVDLFLVGIFVANLLTIPATATTFDVYAQPDITIEAGQVINLVFDLSNWAGGSIGNLLANFEFVPL